MSNSEHSTGQYTVWARGLNCHQQICDGHSVCVKRWRCLLSSEHRPSLLSVCWHSLHYVINGQYICRGYLKSLTGSLDGKRIKMLAAGGDRLLVATESARQLLLNHCGGQWQPVRLQASHCGTHSAPLVTGSAPATGCDTDSGSVGDCSVSVCSIGVGSSALAACADDGSLLSLDAVSVTHAFSDNDADDRRCRAARDDAGARRVVQVACGRQHVLLLTAAGDVLSFGSGSRGQLGLGDLEDCESACHVTALAGVRVVQVAAGSWHSLALSRDGDVYAWGWNESGQLGHDPGRVTVAGEPLLLADGWPLQVCVTQLAAGGRHSLALTDDGRVFGWGNNCFGQLTSTRSAAIYPPCQLQLPPPPAATSCSSSSCHVISLVAGEDNSLLVCCRRSGNSDDAAAVVVAAATGV